jgi:hypothetical protein
MSIPVVCPNCSAKLNAPDSAAGKRVKCPKCQTGMVVPEPLPEASPFEVVDDPQPAAKAAPKVAGRPRAAVKAEADDEDDRRRKRRRDEDDEDDDRPKKKKKKAAADNSMLIRNVVGGVLLVVLVAVAGYVFYDRAQKAKEEDTAGSSNAGGSQTPPAEIPLPGAPVGVGGGPRPKGPVGPIGPAGPGGNPVGKKPIGTPGQPTTLTSPKGFKVTFPGPYQSEDPPEEVRKKLGVPLTVHGSVDLNAGLVFLAGTAEFPVAASADEKKELVGRIVNTVIEDDGKTPLTSRKNVTVGGQTWEELTTKEVGGGTAVSRVLQTDQRVYVLAVLSFGGTPPAEAVKKFFDSFELTAPAGK